MLKIRADQMKSFDEKALRQFENEMWDYSQQFAPEMCKAAKEKNVRLAIRKGIEGAASHGFTNRGPVRFYIELMFSFGCDFDSDPQHKNWIKSLLNTDDDNQAVRADLLFESYKRFYSNAIGQKNVYLRRALGQATEFDVEALSGEPSATDFRGLIKEVYPERLADMSASGIRNLGEMAFRKSSEQHGATSSASVAISLAFTIFLGHKYDCDLLYPWLQRVFDRTDLDGDEKYRLAAEKSRIYAAEAIRFWEGK